MQFISRTVTLTTGTNGNGSPSCQFRLVGKPEFAGNEVGIEQVGGGTLELLRPDDLFNLAGDILKIFPLCVLSPRHAPDIEEEGQPQLSGLMNIGLWPCVLRTFQNWFPSGAGIGHLCGLSVCRQACEKLLSLPKIAHITVFKCEASLRGSS